MLHKLFTNCELGQVTQHLNPSIVICAMIGFYCIMFKVPLVLTSEQLKPVSPVSTPVQEHSLTADYDTSNFRKAPGLNKSNRWSTKRSLFLAFLSDVSAATQPGGEARHYIQSCGRDYRQGRV